MRLVALLAPILALSACTSGGCGPRPDDRFPLCSDCRNACSPGGCSDCYVCTGDFWRVQTIGLCAPDAGADAGATP